jgi:hypothetical protein
VFAVPRILAYQAEVCLKERNARLRPEVHAATGGSQQARRGVSEALRETHFLGNALAEGLRVLDPVTAEEALWMRTGLSERRIRA